MIIKGITITLYTQTSTGFDGFNRPTYSETAVSVDNVLVAPSSETEVTDTLNMTGRKAVYTLAIPKGDNNDWTDKKVTINGVDYRTIGQPLEGIDALVPLDWNKKVRVEVING